MAGLDLQAVLTRLIGEASCISAAPHVAVLMLNGREPFQLGPEDERLLESFGDQAALAIRKASLYAAEGAARQAAERPLAEGAMTGALQHPTALGHTRRLS